MTRGLVNRTNVCLDDKPAAYLYKPRECGGGPGNIEYIAQARAIAHLNDQTNPGHGPNNISPSLQWEVQIGPTDDRPDIVYYNRSKVGGPLQVIEAKQVQLTADGQDTGRWAERFVKLGLYVGLLNSIFANKSIEGWAVPGTILAGYVDDFTVEQDDKGECEGQGDSKLVTYEARGDTPGILAIYEKESRCRNAPIGTDLPNSGKNVGEVPNVEDPPISQIPFPHIRPSSGTVTPPVNTKPGNNWLADPSTFRDPAKVVAAITILRTAYQALRIYRGGSPVISTSVETASAQELATATAYEAAAAGGAGTTAAEIEAMTAADFAATMETGMELALVGEAVLAFAPAVVLGVVIGLAACALLPFCHLPPVLTFGDPHMVTIDGLHYDLQSAGEFTFAHSDSNEVNIQARLVPGSTAWSVLDRMAMWVNTHAVELRRDGTVLIDGTSGSIPAGSLIDLGNGASILRTNAGGDDHYIVVWPGDGDRPALTWTPGATAAAASLHFPTRADSDLVGLVS